MYSDAFGPKVKEIRLDCPDHPDHSEHKKEKNQRSRGSDNSHGAIDFREEEKTYKAQKCVF